MWSIIICSDHCHAKDQARCEIHRQHGWLSVMLKFFWCVNHWLLDWLSKRLLLQTCSTTDVGSKYLGVRTIESTIDLKLVLLSWCAVTIDGTIGRQCSWGLGARTIDSVRVTSPKPVVSPRDQRFIPGTLGPQVSPEANSWSRDKCL